MKYLIRTALYLFNMEIISLQSHSSELSYHSVFPLNNLHKYPREWFQLEYFPQQIHY